MTIHSDWLHLMKGVCPQVCLREHARAHAGELTSCPPQAFSKDPPIAQPDSAFIDAQIKLMAMPRPSGGEGEERGAPTWALFLRKQFVRPIETHWRCVVKGRPQP